MNKKILVILVVAVVIIAVSVIIYIKQFPTAETPINNIPAGVPQELVADPSNLQYTIENQTVDLRAGRAEVELVPGSASKQVTTLFKTFDADLPNGTKGSIVILTQNSGGTGTFYYVAVASKGADGVYCGTNGILLGDRIELVDAKVDNGNIVVDYKDRNSTEPMLTKASDIRAKYLQLQGNVLVEKQK